MPVTLRTESMQETLDEAFLLASNNAPLPTKWLHRAEKLRESPSVAFIAAVGSVLLAKATDPSVDVFVIQEREGTPGAFSLRGPARVLGLNRHAYGYDIGSTSDRDPINHGTLIGSTRWDAALQRIAPAHKPFFQVVLQWLSDINTLDKEQALLALAAYIRVRQSVAAGTGIVRLPSELERAPSLADLIQVVEGFAAADPENGARGMAVVAAAFRAAGLDARLASRNDPRRIDIPISRAGALVIAAEVKQDATTEAVAETLARDSASAGAGRALLAVLRPGTLVRFSRAAVVERAERDHGVVLRVTEDVRQLIHEALVAGLVDVDAFRGVFPRAFADALREIRVEEGTLDTWAAIATQWA